MVVIFVAVLGLYPLAFVRFPMGWKFDPRQNRTILGILPATNKTVLVLHDIYVLVISTFLSFITFFAVVLCTILLSLSLQKSKAWRDANKNSTSIDSPEKAEKGPESIEKQSKETRAVKMVICITTVFIVTNIPSCVHMVAVMAIPGFTPFGRYAKVFDVSGMPIFGLNSVNSGANLIIYYRMSQKFRLAVNGLLCKEI